MKYDRETYRIFDHIRDVDISEQDIWDYEPEVLRQLLIDHTMSAKARREANDQTVFVNIFWATSDYESARESESDKRGFRYKDQIRPEAIIGSNGRVIMPRVLKDRQLQLDRTKDKAEVFTPSWVCNAQNNLVDDAWFGPGYENAFNTEEIVDGIHTWKPSDHVNFPESDKQKTWKKYVTDNRMEITCGEAPYLVSRYDTTTGQPIPIRSRVGLLDRKLRVINENVTTEKEWYDMAEKAIKHTYGYEWQGDNLLLAREAVLYTYIEYYIDRFNKKDEEGNYLRDEQGQLNIPDKNRIINCARWISWNLWQMDGIKMVVPDSCHDIVHKVEAVQMELDFFGDAEPVETPEPTITPCPGCATGNVHRHNGEYCLIRDWNKKKPANWQPKPGEDPHSSPWQKITFISLLNGGDAQAEDENEEENI